MNLRIIVPKIFRVGVGPAGFVREVIQPAAAKAEEVVVATLERAEIRQPTEMPLTEQGRAVSGLLQQRRQSRMFWREPQLSLCATERFVQANGKTILVAAGNQCG